MSDEPELPPVGQLVQITYRDGNPWVPDEDRPVLVRLGHLDNEGVWWTVRDGDISSVDVISWCRVLVAADNETTQRALRMKLWTEMDTLDITEVGVRALSVALSHVALAALREAAIR